MSSFYRILFYITLFVNILSAQPKTLDLFSDPYQGYRLFFKAVEAGADGELKAAEAGFRQVLSLLPFHNEAKLNRLILEDLFAGKLDKKSVVRIFSFQKNFYNMEDLEELAQQIDRLVQKKPQYFPLYLLKGNMYYREKNDSLSLKSYNKAIQLKPQFALSYFYRGRLYARMELTDPAISDFSACLNLEPDFSRALFQRGILYSLQKNYDQAIKDFEHARAIRDNSFYHFKIYETYNNRGVQRLRENLYREAKNDFDKAIRLDTRFGEVYMNRAMAYRGLGLYDSALVDFNRAEEKGSQSADFYFFRGETQYFLGHNDTAVTDLKQAILMNDKDSRYHYLLAEIKIEMQNFSGAVPYLKRVLELNPEKEWAFYLLAFSYDNMKEYRRAIIYYEAFLEIASAEYFRHITHVRNRVKLLRKYLNTRKQSH